MIAAATLRPFRGEAEDHAETERLKTRLAGLRAQQSPFCLGAEEMEEILRWKLRGQHGRGRGKRAANTDLDFREVTRAAFALSYDDVDQEARIRITLLTALPGIGIGVASAILALSVPDRYCVIDFRGWRALYGEEKTTFAIGDYLRYRRDVARLASQLGWSVQETDEALWAYDQLA